MATRMVKAAVKDEATTVTGWSQVFSKNSVIVVKQSSIR